MRIHAVCVVDRAVPHCEHTPPRAHGHSGLEVRCPDVLAVVAQPLRRLAEQLPHFELFSDDAGPLLPAECVAVVEQEIAAVRRHVRHRPPAAPLVRDELLERRVRHAEERLVAIVQVNDHAPSPSASDEQPGHATAQSSPNIRW